MTAAPEMVERVARVMWEVDSGLNWEAEMADYIMMARAAIEAMRESTEAMLAAVCDPHAEVYLSEQTVKVLWDELLNTALEPTKDAATAAKAAG